MEWFRFIRERIWHNTGFDSLREIAPYIEAYEPWFEPQIVPVPQVANDEPNGVLIETDEEEEKPTPSVVYPDAEYYSVEDYHKLYLSGAITPTDVAEAL